MARRIHHSWHSFFGVSSRQRLTERRPLGRRLRIEPLEDRRLLSITVSTLSDIVDGNITPGNYSLREAIGNAAIGELIAFSVSGTIQLTNVGHAGEIVINKGLTIQGPSASQLTIRAHGGTAAAGDGSRIFNIDDGTSTALAVSINGLTLTGADVSIEGGAVFSKENLTVTASTITANYATASGAAIHNDGGTLIVTNSTISGNSSFSYSGGGGISSRGDTTLIQSAIADNTAGYRGGGIWHQGGTLTLTDCTITGNSTRISTPFISEGGGVWSDTNLIITRCTISGNLAGYYNHGWDNGGGFGGGVFSQGSLTIAESSITGNFAVQGRVLFQDVKGYGGVGGGVYHTIGAANITSSTISNNTARYQGGGVVNHLGSLAITDSTISGNYSDLNGGGVYSTNGNFSRSSASLTVTRSTISGNTARSIGGGIISRGANLTVTSSTISGNTAGRGGGIDSDNTNAQVSYSTIAGNSASGDGGGIWSQGNLATRLTIVAGNTRGAASEQNDVTGNVTAAFTLFGVNTGATIINSGGMPTNLFGTAAAPIDPLLGPLADNGGPTLPNGSKMLTRAPLPGSPAIDAGDPNAMVGLGDVPPFDQRGAPFGRIYNGRIDIGAVEVQPSSDFDIDGDSDGFDFLAWQSGFGSAGAAATRANGNADNDSDVDGADLAVWKSTFGNPALVAAAAPAASAGLVAGDAPSRLSPQAVDAAMAWQMAAEAPGSRPLFRPRWLRARQSSA